MELKLEVIGEKIYQDRLSGMSFTSIARKYMLASPQFVQNIFYWYLFREPISWRHYEAQLEINRLQELRRSHWLDAKSGNREAMRSVLEISKQIQSLLEYIPSFPTDINLWKTTSTESSDDQKLLESLLKEQIKVWNEHFKDFDLDLFD
jgi:hypothetical protein